VFDLLKPTLYVRVYRNRMLIRELQAQREQDVHASFSTERLLVGQFNEARVALRQAIKLMLRGKWMSMAPTILVQPMEMTEGGLSQVEERIFHELGAGVGGRRVRVHIGDELNDEAVRRQLDGR